MKLEKELKRIREARGITVDEASDSTGLAKSYIHSFEAGKREIYSFDIVAKMADYYQIPLDYLKVFMKGESEELPVNLLREWDKTCREIRRNAYLSSVLSKSPMT